MLTPIPDDKLKELIEKKANEMRTWIPEELEDYKYTRKNFFDDFLTRFIQAYEAMKGGGE